MSPPLVALTDARLSLGTQRLFAGLSVGIGKGDRVALVGRNGSGKSTLLRVLAGEIELDDGERFEQPRTRIAYLPQEPSLPSAGSFADAVIEGLPPTERGQETRFLAEIALQELALEPDRPLTPGLSGGERRRVSLARAFVSAPDILLLDEPTNHLDLPAIEWLEQRLAGFTGGFVAISHDRAFLAAVSQRLWWLDRGNVRTHEAGFAAFDDWSETVLAAQEAELERLDKRLAVEREWLHKGVTARRKRNQGRLHRLQEMRRERREHAGQVGQVGLAATTGAVSGKLVVEAIGLGKRFAERTIVDRFGIRILRGDRIGIIGPNGAGKTTLVKLLLGEVAPDTGSVRLGTNLQIARFEQDRGSLDPDASPWSVLCPDGGDRVMVGGQSRHVAGYLRDFLFREEQFRQPVRALSGGERNRLLLARVLARPSNLMVLDEPTNDLDMETLDLLEEAIAGYQGTLLLVSHDRDFLDRLVTSTVAFEGPAQVREYAGGYSDFLAQRAAPTIAAPRTVARSKAEPSPVRPRGFDPKLQRELDRLPGRIAAAERAVEELERRLSEPDFYGRDPDGFGATARELDTRRAEQAALEERWLDLEDQRERAAPG